MLSNRFTLQPTFNSRLFGLLDRRSGKCQNDHGGIRSTKMSDVPFYHRGQNGRMKSY